MENPRNNRFLLAAAIAAGIFWGWNVIFPLLIPFVAGLLLALAAEPMTGLLCRRLSFRRGFAAFLGVSATLILISTTAVILCGILIRELTGLAAVLPDLESAARQGMTTVQDWLLSLAQKAPDGIRTLLTRSILGLFNGGSALYDQALARLPRIATGFLSALTGSALGVGTGLLSAFLISARLPEIKKKANTLLPQNWRDRYLPAVKSLRTALGGWLKAQGKLMALTFTIVCIGLLLLGVPHAALWAALIALVDAVPMLGTGLVLIPWALICLLQDQSFRAIGLLGIFGVATVCRTTLEPRLLGKQLGLDPLVTLVSLYLGYQLLGLPGLILSPLLAVTAIQIFNAAPKEA